MVSFGACVCVFYYKKGDFQWFFLGNTCFGKIHEISRWLNVCWITSLNVCLIASMTIVFTLGA